MAAVHCLLRLVLGIIGCCLRLLCDGIAPFSDPCGSESLDRFVRMGMVTLSDGQIAISPDAQPYARSIAACFDAYLRPAETRFSHAV